MSFHIFCLIKKLETFYPCCLIIFFSTTIFLLSSGIPVTWMLDLFYGLTGLWCLLFKIIFSLCVTYLQFLSFVFEFIDLLFLSFPFCWDYPVKFPFLLLYLYLILNSICFLIFYLLSIFHFSEWCLKQFVIVHLAKLLPKFLPDNSSIWVPQCYYPMICFLLQVFKFLWHFSIWTLGQLCYELWILPESLSEDEWRSCPLLPGWEVQFPN